MADVPPGVKGMNDILAPEAWKWQFLEQHARDVLEAFAYHELRTPVLEYTPLFVRSVGEVTDVVEKQMYTFDDRDGKSVSLRPEGTASAVRAYVENAQWNKEPLTRWYYIGPMFRHERAQRGRLRQFYQVGAEVFGSGEPSMDAEMIAMLVDKLVRYFSQHRDKLDEDSRRRLETNPLRILDSKNPDVIAVAAGAPKLIDELNDGSRARFQRVRTLLDALGVKHAVDPGLVRGLDYYTGTIFELKTKAGELGSQNTVAGGGRYDRLVSSLGGPSTPAIGFALGIERALLAIPDTAESYEPALAVFFAPMDAAALDFALPIVHRLRGKGIRIEIEHRQPAKTGKMLARASKLRARAAVIIGSNEIASGMLTQVAVADLESKIRQLLD